jgi:hypothetical protein
MPNDICAGSVKKARGLWIGEGLPDLGDSDDLSEDTSDEEKEARISKISKN